MDADTFHMGPGTLKVSRAKLHGGNRERLVERLRSDLPKEQHGIVLLEGGHPFHVYKTDGEGVFRQDSYFFWCFGVNEEDYYGAIDLRTGKATLFMPRLPDSYAVWMGALKTPEECGAKYAVDEVRYVDEMAAALKGAAAPCLHVLRGTNTDSGMEVKPAQFEGAADFKLEQEALFRAITECRVFKSPEEVEIIRYANEVGCRGHVAAMRASKPGAMEYQLEAAFLHECYSRGGCRLAPYTPISASGPNGAILHYGHAGAPNDRQVQDGDLVLADFGCLYYGFGSDVTATWPANGKFSLDQRAIYEAVLRSHEEVKAAMRPGVAWPDMHRLANRCILEGLLALGCIKGDVGEMLDADLGALFMPHGLGHFLGLDTHDVGGYPPGGPERIQRPGYKSLRTARSLEAGMVITVEPGLYFNFPALLRPALQDPAKAKFLVPEVLSRFEGMGGVRIEDNVLITPTGAESLTKGVPRRADDIEAVMAGAPWP